MAQARDVMGPDALLLDTKEAPPEARHLGEYEVVFGEYADAPAMQGTDESPSPEPDALEEIRRGVEEIRDMLARDSSESRPGAAPQRNTSWVAGVLVKAGVESALARNIAEAVKGRMQRRAVLDISRPRAVGADWDDASLLLETQEKLRRAAPWTPNCAR